MSKFNWESIPEGYKAIIGDDDYVLDVWRADSGGWHAAVNEGTVIDLQNNDDKLFAELDTAKTAAEMMAEELMREDGYTK